MTTPTEAAKKNQVDWITPEDDVKRIIVPVLGGMPAVDPCAHELSFIKAETSFYGCTRDDDGYKAKWSTHGETAFICPTFGNTPPKAKTGKNPATLEEVCPHEMQFHRLTEWVAKMALEGNGMTVLALLPNYVDRAWFHNHIVDATAFCLLERRRQFFLPDGHGGTFQVKQPMGGHQYVLWTKQKTSLEVFYDVLADDGLIVEPG